MVCYDYPEVICSICGRSWQDGYHRVGEMIVCEMCWEEKKGRAKLECSRCEKTFKGEESLE